MKTSTGLDIGSHTLKLVELTLEKTKPILTKYAVLSLDGRPVKDGILELVSNAKLTNRQVNLGIQGPSVIVRYIQMPRMNDEELEGAIKFEAEKYIPFTLDEVVIDYIILEKEVAPNNMKILLVAVKREFVNNLLELMNEVKLEAGLIDVDSFAVVNAFTNSAVDEESSYALLNIGAKITNMSIVQKKLPYFTRDIMLAGDELTNKVKEKFYLDFKEAETLKIEPKDKIDAVKEIFNPVLEKIISELRLSFDYFESQYEKSIGKLYLSGGTSYLFNITDVLRERLGIEVFRWDPLAGIGISEGLDADELNKCSGQLAVAVGLALRR